MNLENRTEQFRTPFCLIDPAGKFMETNYSFVNKFNLGNSPSDLINHIKDFFPNEEQRKQFVEKLVSAQKDGIEFSCDIPVLGANLRTTWIQATFTPIIGPDNSGFVFNGVDITNRKIKEIQKEQEIKELKLRMEEAQNKNDHDPLTGIYSRTYLESKLTELLAFRSLSLAVMVIDLNDFKGINDTLGHLVGDKELKRVANIFKNIPERKGDLVGRWGGDEFFIILSDVDNEGQVEIFLKKFNDVCEDQKIKCSYGVVLSGEIHDVIPGAPISNESHTKIAERLFKLADERMYQHKIIYKNQK